MNAKNLETLSDMIDNLDPEGEVVTEHWVEMSDGSLHIVSDALTLVIQCDDTKASTTTLSIKARHIVELMK